jgi:hypothetical protein
MAIDLADILNLGLTAYNASQGNAGGAASGLSGILGPIFSSGTAPTTGGQGGGFLSSIFGSDSPVSKNPVSEGGGIMDSLGSIFGGSSSGPTGYTGPSVWPQVLGSLASSFRATPRAGASREEREKANRYNMLAGILGAVATGYGKASDEAAKQKATSELYQIFTGAAPSTVGAESSDPMQKLPMPYSEPPARKEDYIQNLPMPAGAAPLTKSDLEQTQEIRFDKLPSQTPTPLSRNERLAEFMRQNPAMAGVAGQLLAKEQESQFKLADLEARKAAVQSQREMADAKLAFLKDKLQQDIESGASDIQIRQRANEIKAAEVEASKQKFAAPNINQQRQVLTSQAVLTQRNRDAIEREINQLKNTNVRGFTPDQLDQFNRRLIELETKKANLNSTVEGLQSELGKLGQSFSASPTSDSIVEGVTTPAQVRDTLKILGVPDAEKRAEDYATTITTPSTDQVAKALATPTATPTQAATMSPEEIAGISGRATLNRAERETKRANQQLIQEADQQYLSAHRDQYNSATRSKDSVKSAIRLLNTTTDELGQPLSKPALLNAQQTGVKLFIQGLDNSVVYPKELDAAWQILNSKLGNLKNNAASYLGVSTPLTAEQLRGLNALMKAKQRFSNAALLQLNKGNEQFRSDYLNGSTKPIRSYAMDELMESGGGTSLAESTGRMKISDDLRANIAKKFGSSARIINVR